MTPATARLLLLAHLAAVTLMASADPSDAQERDTWNEPAALELVARARAGRRTLVVDSAFRSYSGQARGYVYFFIDRPDSDERTLVKADQVAIELFWEAPNRTKQRIIGMRDEKLLPTNISYHLDHLTVVQDDFGDFIRLGDGDEVAAVPHPVGPRSDETYDFRLADSLTIRYGAGAEEIRVYEVRVRPKQLDRPGFIGSVFLDRRTASIVRMNFTFTPDSYVDPYLDYIRISLDNSLWMSAYWLPYKQEIEIRRELPVLDFMMGSIIRGRFEIGDYDFNPTLAATTFAGRAVSAAPQAEREAFLFERGLFDDLAEEGLAPSPSMEQIRSRARSAIQKRYLTGLSPLRLHLASVSDGVRYNRAEGSFTGVGTSVRPRGDVLLRAQGGYAWARAKLSASVSARGIEGPLVPELDLYWERLNDIGRDVATAGMVNSLSALGGGADYLDPYWTRGAAITLAEASGSTTLTLRWERYESAEDVVSGADDTMRRPVRPIDDGTMGSVQLSVPVTLPALGRGTLTGTLARHDTRTFAALHAEGIWSLANRTDGRRVNLRASAGWVGSGAPAQALFLLGGRGTLPGYGYRAFEGDRYWLTTIEGTLPLVPPLLGLRVFAAVGATRLGRRTLPRGWTKSDSEGVRASLGAGIALGWDVLRFDVAHGLRGGQWDFTFSVTPILRTWL